MTDLIGWKQVGVAVMVTPVIVMLGLLIFCMIAPSIPPGTGKGKRNR